LDLFSLYTYLQKTPAATLSFSPASYQAFVRQRLFRSLDTLQFRPVAILDVAASANFFLQANS